MTFAGFFGLIALLLASSEAESPSADDAPKVRVMTIQQEMILRVPVRPYPRLKFHWEEDKGPKCLPVQAIAGALLSGSDSIDIVLRNRQRVRARLDNDCEGLDFYGGLYLQTEDGQLCAKRDVIRSRMGGTCTIEKFRMLVPKIER
jgi:hypothetical protein